MKMLDEVFGERFLGMINDVVDTTEVVDGLHDVIHVDSVVGDADSVGLENVACLVMGQPDTRRAVDWRCGELEVAYQRLPI